MGEAKGDLGDTKIEIELDKSAKTLTIKDKGIGMTKDEIEKYISQIAFSGAEEFVNKYKDKVDKNVMIGHFGLGFYSAFMVAKKVEIFSLSYKEGAKGVRWECDGSPEYQIEEISNHARKEVQISYCILQRIVKNILRILKLKNCLQSIASSCLLK